MISLDVINQSILELEQRDTCFATCEKLADLYVVRDHLTGQTVAQPVPLDVSGKSEFLQVVDGRDSVKVWAIIDETVSVLKSVYPKTYDLLMDKIRHVPSVE